MTCAGFLISGSLSRSSCLMSVNPSILQVHSSPRYLQGYCTNMKTSFSIARDQRFFAKSCRAVDYIQDPAIFLRGKGKSSSQQHQEFERTLLMLLWRTLLASGKRSHIHYISRLTQAVLPSTRNIHKLYSGPREFQILIYREGRQSPLCKLNFAIPSM